MKRTSRGQTGEERRYNACLSKWRCVAECVNGRLKVQFPRLRTWSGRDDGAVLHAAWLYAAVTHNIFIARYPMVRSGSRWEWLLRGRLLSSDPWVAGGSCLMAGSGSYCGLPPLPGDGSGGDVYVTSDGTESDLE